MRSLLTEGSGIVAVPAVHPKLAAVLGAHLRVQRAKAIRTLCLYLSVFCGGFAWVGEFWKGAPDWLSDVGKFGWPTCLGFLVGFYVLEWSARARLERLLADDGTPLT